MRLLFWNTYNNRDINKYIWGMVEENKIDIVILAEYNSDIKQLDQLLMNSSKRLHRWSTIGSERIKIWGNYIDVQPGIQDKYYSLQVVNGECIICGVHMFSNMNGERNDERQVLAFQVMREIDELKKKINSDKVIIVGDMNESPYEKTCLSARGFHGLPALMEEDDKYRRVSGTIYEKMYNPMWNLFGDFSYPPGTYYLSESKLCTPSWYMIDQIIISHSMINILKRDDLKIIVECMGEKFYTKKKHPDKKISDHFPVMCGFEIM